MQRYCPEVLLLSHSCWLWESQSIEGMRLGVLPAAARAFLAVKLHHPLCLRHRNLSDTESCLDHSHTFLQKQERCRREAQTLLSLDINKNMGDNAKYSPCYSDFLVVHGVFLCNLLERGLFFRYAFSVLCHWRELSPF